MKFVINMFNHNELGQRSLEDVIQIIAHQLRACGHIVEWNNTHFIEPWDGYNVLVEGFTPWSLERIARAHFIKKARFLFICTEEPGEVGFNGLKVGDFKERQQIFPHAAKLCDGILSLVPGAEKWYGQFAPAHHIELGYAPTLMRKQERDPEWMFGFYGSISPRRLKILRRIERRVRTDRAVRVVGNFREQEKRDAAMLEAKILLQIRIVKQLGLVSSSRCATALHLGRMVYAEPHAHSHPWDQVIEFAKTEEEFIDKALVYAPFYKAIFQSQFEKFKDVMAPQNCVGRQVDELHLQRNIQHKMPGFTSPLTPVIMGGTI